VSAPGESGPPPVLLAALAPRLLRVAGELTTGTILWMGNERAIETHIAPKLRAAATAAGRPAPRIVAGLPVAVHDDVAEARATAAEVFVGYGTLPNYRRLLDIGGADGPADAAIVGDEATVSARIEALFEAGATDVWAAPFPVGDDRAASRTRTRALLTELANA
jgi:alkanesulfonate monooxygenase SsuD/methylene tetrahydromethanopterin reductase-like flavin-dependent oxidoreductase (luciferase family)